MTKAANSAFSLVEVTIALGLMAFALVALFGLVPVGLTANQNSVEMNTMSNIAQNIVADLRSTADGATKSPRFEFSTTGGSSPQIVFLNSSGEKTGAVGSGPNSNTSRYRAAVAITSTDSSKLAAKQVRIVVSRPALADSGTTGWPKNAAGVFEAFSAITTK